MIMKLCNVSYTRLTGLVWACKPLIPPFIDPVMEQKSVSRTYFPIGDPSLSNPREEDSLEAMVPSKLLSKCQVQLLTGSSKQIVIQTLIIKRRYGYEVLMLTTMYLCWDQI